MMRKCCPALFLLLCGCLFAARPLNIIIITSHDSAEDGYTEFLQEIYLDNAAVLIDDDRYKEPLRDVERQELLGADLIIVSSDNTGGEYNEDSAFWASLPVPVLSHNISICRSNDHDNWDWFSSGQTTVSVTDTFPIDPNEAIFDAIDLSGGSITLFDEAMDVSLPDELYTGSGTLLTTDAAGLPVIVRFDGNVPNYYTGSLYDPNGEPRIYFALPEDPVDFFEHATPAGLQLLRNVVTGLLPECWLCGDVDCDRDVDMADFAAFSADWFQAVPSMDTRYPSDLYADGFVDAADLEVLADCWLAGYDDAPPQPDPAEWTDEPEVQDGGYVQMKAASAEDNLHGVQYRFECLENSACSSPWQYDREFFPSYLPTGVTLSFQVKARDTSSRFNETTGSAIRTVRTDGLFYYSADASAAVALDNERFIMSDDELNILQVYNWNMPASDPNRQTDIGAAINIDPTHPEADIEGATWFNDRVFWITSHGRSREGDYWPSRYRFFATTIAPDGIATVDGVYESLIDHLIQYDRVWNLGLETAIGTVGDHIDEATIPDLAPKVNGLNIEGLCTTADGTKMLIGFRNPRPQVGDEMMALVIPLANPEAVVLNGADPNLEPPLLIDLKDLGIRSMEYSPSLGEYLIVAGSHLAGEDEPLQTLYKYDFDLEDKDKLAEFTDITPEAIFQFPDANDIHLLSDDGTRMIETPSGTVMNKLLPHAQRTYRTRTVRP